MKRAYYIGSFIPPEWISAHGFEPCRLQLSAKHDNRGMRAGLCPYADSLMNRIPSLNDGPIVVQIACDQMRRAVEWVAKPYDENFAPFKAVSTVRGRIDPPVFAFDVPATCHSDARERYRLELEQLGRFLVKCGGREPIPDGPPGGARRADGPGWKSRRPKRNRIPLAVVGGPLLTEHNELFETIERYGGRVALNGSEGSDRTSPVFDSDLHGHADMLEMLSAAYFDTIADAFRRPDDALDSWLSQRIEERTVKGIVFYSYVWCDLWRAKLRHLAATASLPVLCLELGPEVSLHPRTITRIEAFLESLR